MNKDKLLLIILILLMNLNFISALCNESQIDINSASLEELDGLYGIGPVKAQAIIDTRPFETIDDLINVNGIGEVTLNKIKEQGLVCINEELIEEKTNNNTDEEEIIEENTVDDKNEVNNNLNEKSDKLTDIVPVNNISNTVLIAQPIKLASLNTKDIKTGQNSESKDKEKLAIYGLVLFAVLLASLFVLKLRKPKYDKNEFD